MATGLRSKRKELKVTSLRLLQLALVTALVTLVPSALIPGALPAGHAVESTTTFNENNSSWGFAFESTPFYTHTVGSPPGDLYRTERIAMTLHSPLSGPVNSGFGGGGKKYKSKIVAGVTVIAFVPFLLSTFAASVTVGNGALEFGQGSQQAIACDSKIYIAMGEEWKSAPAENDPSAGYFRVRAVTVSNLDLQQCAGKKLRVRLIDGNSQEIVLGNIPDAKVLQISLPNPMPQQNISDSTALLLSYLTSTGSPISGALAATVSVSISGTSVYDGSTLSANNADVTFFIDPTATAVNIDGQLVHRTTVETIDNPSAQAAPSATPSPTATP